MVKVLVVYATDYGNTQKMAEAVVSGARSVVNTEVTVKSAETVIPDDMLASDAVLLGTPVHMGSPDWRVKKFIDTVCSGLWMKNSMVGKVGAVFATGSGYGNAGGGCELSLLALLSNWAELGMIIVPLPKSTPGYHVGGLQWGPWARSANQNMEPIGVTPEQLEAAKHHGANVARIAATLKGQNLFIQ